MVNNTQPTAVTTFPPGFVAFGRSMAAEVRSPTNEGELRIGVEAKQAYNTGDV